LKYEEWLENLRVKIEKTYKTMLLMISVESGLTVRLNTGHMYSMDADKLKGYYVWSMSDVLRYNDGIRDIIKDIKADYLKEILK